MKGILFVAILCLSIAGCSGDNQGKRSGMQLSYDLSVTSLELGHKCSELDMTLSECLQVNEDNWESVLVKRGYFD